MEFSQKAREISERMGDIHNAEGANSIESAVRMLRDPGMLIVSF